MDDDYEDDVSQETDAEDESPGSAKDQGAPAGTEINFAPGDRSRTVQTPFWLPPVVGKSGPTRQVDPVLGPYLQVPGHGKGGNYPDQPDDSPAPTPPPTQPAAAPSAATPAPSAPASPAPPIQAVEPAPNGGHIMLIGNGQHQERWLFGPDGSTRSLDASGPQADAAKQQALVAPHQLAALQSQAEHAFPVPNRGQFAQGSRGDVAYAHARNATLAHQASFVNSQARMLGQQQISQGTQQSIADRTKAHEMFLKQQQADQQAHHQSQLHQQTMEGGYLKQVMQIQEQLRKSYGEGTLQGSGKEIKDKDGNTTGRWPTAQEWSKTLQDTLDGWGIPRNVHEFRKQHGFAPLQAPAGNSASATAQYTPEQQAVLDAIAHPQFKR